jgi:hypothetical protein
MAPTALLLGAAALISTACSTTALDDRSVEVERISVPFEALDLDGTDLGEALAQLLATEAPFPEHVQVLAGKPVVIDGYMIPLSWDGNMVSGFLLTRDNLECCMGGAPPWGHWVHAAADGTTAVPFRAGERVRVAGDFQLVHPSNWEPEGIGTGVYELRGWDVRPLD